jgi:uracil-DNA glycosylase family 4
LTSERRLEIIQEKVVRCRLCPRLRDYCEQVGKEKRRAYRDQKYWGKPVPAFGDPRARMAVIGLAPAAHGANRTGRMFTGDRSGDFLYRALYQTGFASQPESLHRGDGLTLRDAWITAPVRCAPPDNKPTPDEIDTCRHYLWSELEVLPNLRVVVVLGRIAMNVYLSILKDRGFIQSRAEFKFGHNVVHSISPYSPWLICSYHPSQQNTSTGRLTEVMLREVFESARAVLTGRI